MKLRNLFISAAVTASIALTGCNQTNGSGTNPFPDGGGQKVYVDIVTLESSGSSGTSLTLRRINDDPQVTYFSYIDLPSADFHKGDRLVISYTPTSNDRFQNGPITIWEAMPTIGKGAVPYPRTSVQTQDWKTDAIELFELHRSGEYLNIIFNASAYYGQFEGELVLDAATAESDMPEYYVIFKRKSPDASTKQYAFYMSYKIEDQWKREDVRGIRIKYTDTKKGATYKDIMKVNKDNN
ncbi:MAG: hypothetical protein J6C95_06845 [Muribaculaceae bacterium]|nr:hypothetical protein [Muribaculaceae bacterium]